MDVFCRCTGCGSCNNEAAIQGGGKCGNTPQKYTINTPDKIPTVRHGYRKFCKPCLRKMELARLATKHSIQLGLVPGHLNRCARQPRVSLRRYSRHPESAAQRSPRPHELSNSFATNR